MVKRLKNVLLTALLTAVMLCLFRIPALAAVSESDIQSQVTAAGKETVSGNVLIWFLCAVSFLKISQKIDSFMASLGVNVGHTGGSMMAEALIATRGLSTIKLFGGGHNSSAHYNSNNGYQPTGAGAGFMSGGLSGIASRSVQNSAVKTATAPSGTSSPGGMGGLSRSGLGRAISSLLKPSPFIDKIV